MYGKEIKINQTNVQIIKDLGQKTSSSNNNNKANIGDMRIDYYCFKFL